MMYNKNKNKRSIEGNSIYLIVERQLQYKLKIIKVRWRKANGDL